LRSLHLNLFHCNTGLFQLPSCASALPLSIGRHSTFTSDLATPPQQPQSGRQFEPQLDMGRPPSWLIPYPCLPRDNAGAAAYQNFNANAAFAQAVESTAARGSAASPKTTSSGIVHARQDRVAISQPLEATACQRPGRADKEPGSRSSSLMSHVAWSRDRPRPAAEASDFTGHLHGMSAAPLHPLKQVGPTHRRPILQ